MIRPIDIRLNAAHPELPLSEAFTFTGSPSTVLVRNVPPNCGRWAITSINVAAMFPDGSTTTRAAVQSANGVWVATLPATTTSGRTANGLRIMADGIDENGEAVTGYILGVADFAVASLGITPAPEPGATSYQMLYFDTAPSVLRKGDVTKIDGVLKFYDGTAWLPFAEIDPSDYVPTSRTINGKALMDNVSLSGADVPTTAAPNSPTLANSIQTLTNTTQTLSDSISTLNNTKANKSDATLTPIYSDTPTFTDWTFSDVSDGITDIQQPIFIPPTEGEPRWKDSFGYDGRTLTVDAFVTDEYATNLAFSYSDEGLDLHLTATRVRTDIIGYQLGSQSDKPLQPKGDYAPATNIAKSALASDVQASLGKADTALQTAPVTSVSGKTGAVVLNTTDIQDNSTGTSLASLLSFMNGNIQGKAPLASPAFTGTPTAPTPTADDDSTKVATTAFVQAAVAGATPNLDYVMRVDPETGGIYYTTPDTNA